MEAYCLKCREKREMVDPQPYKMQHGKDSTTGPCSTSGTKTLQVGEEPTAACQPPHSEANPPTSLPQPTKI